MENPALDKNQVEGMLANLCGRVSKACKAVDNRPALLLAPPGQQDGVVAARQVDRIQG